MSFSGVNGVPTSFSNSAFIELLNDFTFEYIKQYITFIDTSPQINKMLNKRFHYEVVKRKEVTP